MKLKWTVTILIIFFIFTSCEIEYGKSYQYGGYLYKYHADYSDGVFFEGMEGDYFKSVLYIPEYIYGQKVIGISDSALTYSNFSEVVFSDEIIFVGSSAFERNSNLQKVYFNDKLSEIGSYAFYNCNNLREIILPVSVETIGKNAFGACHGLQKVQFNDGISEIGAYAFYNCDNLNEIILPASVKTIGENAFGACHGLQKVQFNDGISEVGDYAFYDCDNLNEIILPASVKTIGENAFGQNVWWGNTSVYIYAEVPPEGNGNIPQRNELKIYVPEESVELYKKHRSWVTYRDYIFPME